MYVTMCDEDIYITPRSKTFIPRGAAASPQRANILELAKKTALKYCAEQPQDVEERANLVSAVPFEVYEANVAAYTEYLAAMENATN